MGWADGIGSALQAPVQAAQQSGATAKGYGDLFGLFNTGVLAPANAQADQALAGLGMQEGLINAQYGLQAGNLQQQLGSGMARIGLEQNALGRQGALLPQQIDLQHQLFGLQRQGFDVSQQGIGLEREQAQFQSGQQQRGAWSSATARGATNTSGFGQQLSDIGTQLQQRLSGIGLEEQRLGISRAQSGIQEQQYNLSAQEREAALGDTAKRLGLDRQDLQNRVSSAISQLGLNRAVSTVDIIKAIDDVQNGRITALGGVLGQIAQVDPRLMAPTPGSPSGGMDYSASSGGGGRTLS